MAERKQAADNDVELTEDQLSEGESVKDEDDAFEEINDFEDDDDDDDDDE